MQQTLKTANVVAASLALLVCMLSGGTSANEIAKLVRRSWPQIPMEYYLIGGAQAVCTMELWTSIRLCGPWRGTLCHSMY